MGIVCGKPSSAKKDSVDGGSKERELNRKTLELKAISTRRGESFRAKRRYDSGDISVNLIDKKVTGRLGESYFVQGKEKNSLVGLNNFSGILSVPKSVEGEQVAAGWPSWLVEYAGEAIKGWVPRRADSFEKLEKIGQGTYSSVYKAKDLKQDKLVALKRVRFDSMDPESVKFMAREILILRRLDHINVIKLEGLVTSRASNSVYLIFEYMEHDLVGVASLPGVKFSEPQIKCYMQQLLSGLEHCHRRGVLHRDIKGSNLLIDNNGVLKIADFGLASFYDRHKKIPLTSRVVTLWYRPPELLLGASHYGVAVDLWSTGCILGELYTSKPIMPGKTEVEQLHKIFKLCGSPSEDYWTTEKLPHATAFRPQQPYERRLAETFSDLPAVALGLLETLLSMTPADRGNTADALKSDFFTSKPYACDPSDLPKYPPSKEIDAKLREDEARRKRASDDQTGKYESRRSRETHAVRVPELNDGLTRPTLRQVEVEDQNPKSHNDLYNSRHKEAPSKYTFNPHRSSQSTSRKYFPEEHPRRIAHSGPLSGGIEWSTSRRNINDNSMTSTRDHLSAIAGSIVPRALLSEDSMNIIGSLRVEESRANLSDNSANKNGSVRLKASGQEERPSGSFQTSRKQEQRHRQNLISSVKAENGRTHFKDHPNQSVTDGGKANRIMFSGPLLGPSNNMDEMLKEHDRRIQEVARRTRTERARAGKARLQGAYNLVYISNRGAD